MTGFRAYLATVDDVDARAALEHAWSVAAAAVPEAEEGVSYAMPALTIGGSPLFAVRASARHLALYPFSPPVLDAVADRLGGFRRTKGSVQFSAARPLPDDVVAEIVRLRAAEITR